MIKPSYVIWIFTATCNLNCLHCYTHRFRNLGELSLQDKLRIAKEVGETGVQYVNLTGGEPLIHPHLGLLLETLSQYGVEKSVVTNATAVSYNVVNQLYKTETYVFTTIEGPKHIHDEIRGKWTYDATVRGVELLKRHLGSISIVTTVNKINYRTLHNVVDFAVKVDADELAVLPVMASGRARETKIYISANEYLEALKAILERAREYGLRVSTWCTPWAPLLMKDVEPHFCRDLAGVDIDPMGNILLCDVIDIRITSVRDKNLMDAFREFRNHALVRTVMNPPQLPTVCKACSISWGCRGGCFARSYSTYGELNAGDPLCPRFWTYSNKEL